MLIIAGKCTREKNHSKLNHSLAKHRWDITLYTVQQCCLTGIMLMWQIDTYIEEQLMLQIYQNNVVLLEDKHHIAMFSTEEHLARLKSWAVVLEWRERERERDERDEIIGFILFVRRVCGHVPLLHYSHLGSVYHVCIIFVSELA